jgi:hypothetical protein
MPQRATDDPDQPDGDLAWEPETLRAYARALVDEADRQCSEARRLRAKARKARELLRQSYQGAPRSPGGAEQ